jgi:arylsulfatase A-like enzyme
MKVSRFYSLIAIFAALAFLLSAGAVAAKEDGKIIHDAEHYILEAQHGQKWAAEDKQIDARLAELRSKNGGKPPNIVYILIDDVGFGDFGIPELNDVRGYSTPNLNKLAKQGVSFTRMYTEPSCTPTRTAFLTGRLPVRSHMLEPKVVPPEGAGLNADEVTIAEVLSKAGYNTVHIGKWHQGDIEQAYPHNQGFDVANFPLHNQATFGVMHRDAEVEANANQVSQESADLRFALDRNFRPRGWVLGVEAVKGGKAREWGIEAGEELGYAYYRKLNARYQQQVIEQLQRLAADSKPFFLNYWPQNPVDFGRVGRKFTTANGGTWVESMKELDIWIGELLDEIDRLGIADNTIVVAMGDNGPMKQAMTRSGFSDMVYRGFKAESLEGGIRVPAFIRWPGVIQADSLAGDMIHVTDVYTTFARIAGATEFIPRDRIIDGIDQTALWLQGESHGRRDYLHVYEGPNLAASIKQQFKVHWPPPGAAAFKLPVYDLYRDPRERHPLKYEGMWTVAYFGDMKERHMAFRNKYPDRPETRDVPYAGIENLRPETKALVKSYTDARKLLE